MPSAQGGPTFSCTLNQDMGKRLEYNGRIWINARQWFAPIKISPSVTAVSPAIMRSSVDFPQPEAPGRATNSLLE
jgi:hypothetical protein